MTSDRHRGPELWVLALLLAALIAAVWTWAVDLPHLDEWVLAADLAAEDPGSLLRRAWTPHNEHRLTVPRLLLVGLARLTRWNVRAEVFLGVACAVAVAAILWRLGRRIEGRAHRAIFRSLAAAFVLGLHQVENLVWGWQLSLFLCVASAVAALALLAEGEAVTWGRAAIAAVLGVVSSFSYAAGLMVWPAGAVVLALRSPRAPARPASGLPQRVGPWLAIGATVVIVYLAGTAPRLDAEAAGPGERVLHGLAFLASPVVRAWTEPAVGVIVGAGALVLAALGLAHAAARRAPPEPVWLGLIVFAIGSAAMTALGRAEYGLEQAMTSRYTTVANLLWIGVLGILLSSASHASSARRSGVTFALALGLGAALLAGSVASIDDFVGQHRTRTVARAFLERGVILEELAPQVAGELGHLEAALPIACAQRLALFRRYADRHLECRFELWPEAVEGQRSLPEQRFEWQPPDSRSAGWLRSEAGFTIPVSGDAVDGGWTLTGDTAQRRCLRGAATDAATALPVIEVIVAEGTSARRLRFRRQARRGGPFAEDVAFVGIAGCWRPEPGAGDAPVVVLATTSRGTTGILSAR